MNIEKISIEQLLPYAKNSRTHSDYQVAQLAASIKEFGFNNPIVSRWRRKDHRWSRCASLKKADGSLDHNVAMTGDDLRDFVNLKLFPYLAGFKQSAESPKTIEYKIGEIFSELRNKLQNGYSLRDVVDKVDELKFLSNEDKHELSSLCEDKIKNMGHAGKNGGEYCTPRPLIKAIVKVLNPKIGETVYDVAVGSAGFLRFRAEHSKKKPIAVSKIT